MSVQEKSLHYRQIHPQGPTRKQPKSKRHLYGIGAELFESEIRSEDRLLAMARNQKLKSIKSS
jgi:hypothetical protein